MQQLDYEDMGQGQVKGVGPDGGRKGMKVV